MEIRFKKGFQIKGKPTEVYKALEKVRLKHGGALTPEVVVEEAKRKNNPLHKEFEWKDDEAARLYRLSQARYLVRSIEVVREDCPTGDTRVYEITAGAKSKAAENYEYKTLEDILNNPEDREAMVQRALRDLQAWLRKYGMLHELDDVIRSVTELLS